MEYAIRGVLVVATGVIVAGSTVGCGMIGYVVGGVIDGTTYCEDSVSVTTIVDSAGTEYRGWDSEHLTSLVKDTRPGKWSRVTVVTRNGTFTGDSLFPVLAVKGESLTGNEAWRPGETITLTFTDAGFTQVKGRFLQMGEGIILLWMNGEDFRHWFDIVTAYFSERSRDTPSAEPARPGSSRSITIVPGLVLGQESPPLFLPLLEVEQIRVTRRVTWGLARTGGYVVGTAFDVFAASLGDGTGLVWVVGLDGLLVLLLSR